MNVERTSVVVCRGCCCGTADKHPTVDHDRHLKALRSAMPHDRRTKLVVADCLGHCERSNVVAIRTGGVRRWFGEVLDDDAINTLVEWLRAGADGPLPTPLTDLEFVPATAAPAVVSARMLALTPEEITDLSEASLQQGRGTWTMGVHGASADFAFDGTPAKVTRDGLTVIALNRQSAIRLTLNRDTRAFVVESSPPQGGIAAVILCVIASPLASADHGPTDPGPDALAIHEHDRPNALYDAAIGRAACAVCIRGHADTTTVIETLLGRIETRGATTSTELQPPASMPSSVVPALANAHLDLPPGLSVPHGFVPAAVFLPPSGWQLPSRRG
jgi:hypothetical protein